MKSASPQTAARRMAVTLLELLVVVLILSILATIATGVYTNQTRRARIAATRDLIGQLKIAITRYEVDLGVFPPSGSSKVYPPSALSSTNTADFRDGSGLLQLALVHSMSGNAANPASSLWLGPYINVHAEQLKAPAGAETPGNYDLLDFFGNPLIYVKSDDYAINNGVTTEDFTGGTQVFSGSAPSGANPDLPAPNPFLALGETYYNPSGYQIISKGPDGLTLTAAVPPLGTLVYKGAAADDITNFGY
jgi:type II secretory pathway pseudopilin PulG